MLCLGSCSIYKVEDSTLVQLLYTTCFLVRSLICLWDGVWAVLVNIGGLYQYFIFFELTLDQTLRLYKHTSVWFKIQTDLSLRVNNVTFHSENGVQRIITIK